jgi:two-component system, cell cycle sensor histidine kinase and response regulator CckA
MGDALSILIVDDNPDDRALVRRALVRQFPEVRVREVSDARQFQSALTDLYDVVVTDYQLRWSDGVTVLRRVKEHDPACPVIMFTGTGSEEIAVEAMKAGLDDYVLKSPSQLARLGAAIRGALAYGMERRARRKAESRYCDLFQRVPVGLYRCDLHGALREANPAMAAILGYAGSGDLVGIHVADLFADADASRTWIEWLASDADALYHEVRMVRRDGASAWVRHSARRGADQDATIDGSLQDLTAWHTTRQALRDSQRMLATLLRHLPGMAYRCRYDADWTMEYVSAGCYPLTGYRAREIARSRQVTYLELIHPHDRDLARGAVREGVEARRPYHVDYRIVTADGETRWVWESGRAVYGPSGEVLWLEGFVSDITERKQAEERLRESREELALRDRINEAFLMASDAAMFDAVLQVVLEALDSTIGFFGYITTDGNTLACPSLTGAAWEACRMPNKTFTFPREMWGGVWGRALTEGRSQCRNGDLSLPEGHVGLQRALSAPIIDQDGVIGNITVANKPCDYTGDDRRRLEMIASKIAPVLRAQLERDEQERERQRVEAQLALLSAAIEHAPVGVMVTDTEGRIQYANPALERMAGIPRDQLLGRPPAGVFVSASEDTEPFASMRDLAAGRIASWSGSLSLRRPDGSLLAAEAAIAPVCGDSGQVTHYIAIMGDTTREQEMEEQLRQAQKMEAIGQLAGGIAHDFNNLLTVINGYGRFIADALGPGDALYSDAQEIVAAGERAASLTRQLLAFSRRQMLEMTVLSLNDALSEMSSMLQRLIGEQVALRLRLGSDLWTVRADRGQVQQIVINLSINARDAMPEGGTLTLETANVEWSDVPPSGRTGVLPGAYVMLAVSDTGHGMTPEVMGHLFEPFFTTKGPDRGTGLGLATIYGIVKQSGGGIDVSSEPGKGTTFRIYLPRSGEACEGDDPPDTAALPRGGETVLVVEDEDEVRRLTVRMLEHLGYRVLSYGTPQDALKEGEASDMTVDLVVTDVVMPGMSGRDVVAKLLARYPEMRALYMSGHSDEAMAGGQALDAGLALIRKPFTMDELARKVRGVLDGRPS